MPEDKHENSSIEDFVVKKEACIGKIKFAGALYHGGYLAGDRNVLADPSFDYGAVYISDLKGSKIASVLGDSSLTLGPGYYTTNEIEAEKYAEYRAEGLGTPAINAVIVADFPFYDFRSAANPIRNGAVSQEIAEDWRVYFRQNRSLIEDWFISGRKISSYEKYAFLENLTSYEKHLEDFLRRLNDGASNQIDTKHQGSFVPIRNEFGTDPYAKRKLDLRDMLRTYSGDEYGLSPLHGGLWVRFVRESLDCGGITYNETGDNTHFNNAPSYVIYNTRNIKSQEVRLLDK